MSNHERGVLFSFEGIDASGKKTQSRLLFDRLRNKGVRVEYLSFPDYSTAVGAEIGAFLSGRKSYSLEAKHILYSANRYEHKEKLENSLRNQNIVIINRYCESNIAYGVAGGLPAEWLRQLESRMPQSDYIFYLHSTTEVSTKRKSKRDTFEADDKFLDRVSKVYEALSDDPRWFKIVADNTVEIVHLEVATLAENLLRERDIEIQ